MQWKLFADVAEAAGEREVSVDVGDDATVGDAVEALVSAHPDLRGRVRDADGDVRPDVNVLHNGTDVRNESGLETPVEPGDELALFPPVSGG